MSKLKDSKFTLNRDTVKKMLKSKEVEDIALKEAEKLGYVDTNYVGVNRVWVKGEIK